jgi:hypothetical protein
MANSTHLFRVALFFGSWFLLQFFLIQPLQTLQMMRPPPAPAPRKPTMVKTLATKAAQQQRLIRQLPISRLRRHYFYLIQCASCLDIATQKIYASRITAAAFTKESAAAIRLAKVLGKEIHKRCCWIVLPPVPLLSH